MMLWNTKMTVTTVAVAIGIGCQCLALTPAGSRFDCTKPDHRDYTPGWTVRHQSFNAVAAKGDVDLVFPGDSITQGWDREGAATWKTYYGQRKAANFGTGVAPQPLLRLADERLQLVAVKRAQKGEDLILRLFNPTAERLASRVELSWLSATVPVTLVPFALLTLQVARDGEVVETDLLETPLVHAKKTKGD